jgi:hypothetical protein
MLAQSRRSIIHQSGIAANRSQMSVIFHQCWMSQRPQGPETPGRDVVRGPLQMYDAVDAPQSTAPLARSYAPAHGLHAARTRIRQADRWHDRRRG